MKWATGGRERGLEEEEKGVREREREQMDDVDDIEKERVLKGKEMR